MIGGQEDTALKGNLWDVLFVIAVYRPRFAQRLSLLACVSLCVCAEQLLSTCAAGRSVQMKEFPSRADSKSV